MQSEHFFVSNKFFWLYMVAGYIHMAYTWHPCVYNVRALWPIKYAHNYTPEERYYDF